jgi:hypothetical protein
VSAAALFLVVTLSPEFAAKPLNGVLPKELAGRAYAAGRMTRLVTLLWVAIVLGIGQLVVVLFLLHPLSSVLVRLVSATELAGVCLWFWYLRTRMR